MKNHFKNPKFRIGFQITCIIIQIILVIPLNQYWLSNIFSVLVVLMVPLGYYYYKKEKAYDPFKAT